MRNVLALVALVLPQLVHAATPAVAVMPFKDLSGGKGSVGEAIRETVTTDLKDVPGLKVIERGSIDAILGELHLQASKTDLDQTSTVKVGKLLGASLIVTGAYQKSGSNVRVTARFVKVETSEIVGTAKVDGKQSDFLSLQDQVTAELLKSAGIEARHVQKFTQRTRPKLKSLKTVELYGESVVEPDDGKRKEFLLAALNEDPSFVYASHDLDALEARLKQYDAVAVREQNRALADLKQALKTEKDPMQLTIKYTQLFASLMMQRRYRQMIAIAHAIQANPPPTVPPPMPSMTELAGMYLVTSDGALRDYDAVLRDGEKFIAQYPNSNYRMSVRNDLDRAIDEKRKRHDGAQKAADEIAQLDPKQRGDACIVGGKYNAYAQHKDARRMLETCLKSGNSVWRPKDTYVVLILVCAELGDFKAAQRYMDQLEKVDPEQGRSMRGVAMSWPSDE